MTGSDSSARHRAYVRFRDAVVDFSDDPCPDNLVRYLGASRALETSRNERSTRAPLLRSRSIAARVIVRPAHAESDDARRPSSSPHHQGGAK